MKEEKRNFIDFILEAKEDRQLAKDFLKPDTPEELKRFFVDKGYENIDIEECEKLIKAKKDITPEEIESVKAY